MLRAHHARPYHALGYIEAKSRSVLVGMSKGQRMLPSGDLARILPWTVAQRQPLVTWTQLGYHRALVDTLAVVRC